MLLFDLGWPRMTLTSPFMKSWCQELHFDIWFTDVASILKFDPKRSKICNLTPNSKFFVLKGFSGFTDQFELFFKKINWICDFLLNKLEKTGIYSVDISTGGNRKYLNWLNRKEEGNPLKTEETPCSSVFEAERFYYYDCFF